ncbi:response regulator [Massilia sp. PAMC28688]|uniref:hybrid sensor histidine kinase/response regulator n=1 Tax=Massilia sp. PAMC28688 TaxID=2861283 RepID=UPI001C63A8D0|nr:ATP-binding protein [Massilia sp. PAMC28688]QYF94957.1 response regulator [Massilia sp. PAMC28688]
MKIRVHLALMVGTLLVPVVLSSALALDALLDGEREAALRSMREAARATSLATDREWSFAAGLGHALSTSTVLEQGDLAGFYERAREANGDSGLQTALISSDGRQLFNTAVPYGTAIAPPKEATRQRVAQALADSRHHISRLIVGRATGKYVATLEKAATLNDGRRVVISQWYPAAHFQRAFPADNVPSSWLIGIFDQDGVTVLRNRGPAEFVGKLPKEDLLRAIRDGRTDVLRNHSREGTSLYTVLQRSPMSGWTVAVGVPVSEVEAAARNAVMLSAIGVLAALMLAIGAAYLFGKRLVRALDHASHAALDLGRGMVPVIAVSPIDEVGKLESALHDAGLALRRSSDEREVLLADARDARAVAESQNRAKDDFLAMLGHELRNPLSAITSGISLLEYAGATPETSQRARQAIRRQCGLLVNIVDELLDASRVMTGKVSLTKQALDLGAVTRACLDSMDMRGLGKGLAITAEIGAAPVEADPMRLEQIINNLLDNAFKYTPAGGAVRVTVAAQDGKAVLEVADSGIGISAALLPKVFDVFMQGAASIDRAKGGLGIGLAVVRAMVEQHGGSVRADSLGEGRGSVFTVVLPLASGAAPAVEARAEPAAMAPGLRVLVVDDNDDAREMLTQVLTISGYTVLQAINGRQALLVAERELPAVAVIDIGLPDLSGYEVAVRLRALAATARIGLIALTGYGQDGDRSRALESGFDIHLTKPAKLDALVDAIAKASKTVGN